MEIIQIILNDTIGQPAFERFPLGKVCVGGCG